MIEVDAEERKSREWQEYKAEEGEAAASEKFMSQQSSDLTTK